MDAFVTAQAPTILTLTAPDVPGDYKVVCNVICSQDHETMHMKIKVIPGLQFWRLLDEIADRP